MIDLCVVAWSKAPLFLKHCPSSPLDWFVTMASCTESSPGMALQNKILTFREAIWWSAATSIAYLFLFARDRHGLGLSLGLGLFGLQSGKEPLCGCLWGRLHLGRIRYGFVWQHGTWTTHCGSFCQFKYVTMKFMGLSSILDKSIHTINHGWPLHALIEKRIVVILWWVSFWAYPVFICAKTSWLIPISDSSN